MTASISHLSSSINPLHYVERTSMVHYFCVIMTVDKSWVSGSTFCHIMCMLIMCCHGEVEREKLGQSQKPVGLLLIVASLGLGMRIVTVF